LANSFFEVVEASFSFDEFVFDDLPPPELTVLVGVGAAAAAAAVAVAEVVADNDVVVGTVVAVGEVIFFVPRPHKFFNSEAPRNLSPSTASLAGVTTVGVVAVAVSVVVDDDDEEEEEEEDGVTVVTDSEDRCKLTLFRVGVFTLATAAAIAQFSESASSSSSTLFLLFDDLLFKLFLLLNGVLLLESLNMG
jgi:hypothetical protein